MADDVDGNCPTTGGAEAPPVHESHHCLESKGGDSGFESGRLGQSVQPGSHSVDYMWDKSSHTTSLPGSPYQSVGHPACSHDGVVDNSRESQSYRTGSIPEEVVSHSQQVVGYVPNVTDGQAQMDSGQSDRGSLLNMIPNSSGVQVSAVSDKPNVPSTALFTSACNERRKRCKRRRRKPVYGRPRYPAYASYSARLNSFKHWKYHHIVLPEDLAAAGLFYLGVEDKVKCFVSGCGLCNWEKAYSPDKEHKGWFPECCYARLRDENPASLVEFDDSHAVRATLDFGYSKGIIGKAFDIMKNRGVTSPNASELLDVIFELQKQGDPGYSSEEDAYCASSDESDISDAENSQNLSLEREVDITRAHFNRAEANRLKEELIRLEKVMKCHSCGQQPSNMVNLPCGHLATCDTCVYKSSRCGRCNTLIRGVVRVYMV